MFYQQNIRPKIAHKANVKHPVKVLFGAQYLKFVFDLKMTLMQQTYEKSDFKKQKRAHGGK